MSAKTVTPTSVAEVLELAAERLETHGWTKHTFEDEKGRCCVLGAIHRVYQDTGPDKALVVRAKAALYDEVEDSYGIESVTSWNDSQTDKRKVIRLLRRAARKFQGAAR